MNSVLKLLLSLSGAFLAAAVSFNAHALPIEVQDDFEIYSTSFLPVARANVKVFAPGVNDPTEDSRFSDLASMGASPGSEDYTYFIEVTPYAQIFVFSLPKTADMVISGAGIIGGAAAGINPTNMTFDLSTAAGPVDLFITTAWLPNDVGAILVTSAGQAFPAMIGPDDDPPEATAAVPEPGTLLLLVAGLVGLGVVRRSGLI